MGALGLLLVALLVSLGVIVFTMGRGESKVPVSYDDTTAASLPAAPPALADTTPVAAPAPAQ
ncbi:hypothetical protein GCM10022406_22210 [Hymenobacter algoricola]|uniref:Uncharacterized protein n=1 Tax=Hymenobacter algoricola TaxID=486267 RepID=A0ABP7N7L9_9BACT